MMRARGADEHARCRLAAEAGRTALGIGAVRADGHIVDHHAKLVTQAAQQHLLQAGELGTGEESLGDAGLVGHDDQRQARLAQLRQRFPGTGHETQLRGVHVVGHVLDQRAILVQEQAGTQRPGR